MSRDVVKDESSMKVLKKNLKRDFEAASKVAEDGFLKSPMDYAGLLLERHRECLAYYFSHGDNTNLRGIFSFV